MKKTLLTSVALLGLAVGQAQAVSLTPDLTFAGDYSFDGDVDYYDFNVNSTGQVSIWVDTLTDGLDAMGSVFKSNGVGSYNFVSSSSSASQALVAGVNTTGINDFDVSMKNGFVLSDAQNPGISDPGVSMGLDVGAYRYVVTGMDWLSAAEFNGSGTLADGFIDTNTAFFFNDPQRVWSTWDHNTGNGAPHDYEVYIKGDVSEVSAVPVPAAVWLFSSAILGLGAASRKKKSIA